MLKKPASHIIFYLVGFILFIAAENIAPSNLGGPGLDIPVVLLIFVGSGVLFIRGVIANYAKLIVWIPIAIIHIIGISVLILLLNTPVYNLQIF
jgi:hypothetical protein